MVTIREIADMADVSIATVSKIINGKDQHISDATRARVKKILNDTGYVSNTLARGLKTRKTFTLGYIVPDITNPFFAGLARGIEYAAREQDYSVIMSNTDNNARVEERSVKLFKSKMVDGIIFSRAFSEEFVESQWEYYHAILEDTPTVFLDRDITHLEEGRFGFVYGNCEEGMYVATKLLFEKGCRKIACISGGEKYAYPRIRGYYRAMWEVGLETNQRTFFEGDYTIATGAQGIARILSNEPGVDGLVCGNDMIAIGAINYLKEKGISVPDQIQVIGMDNIPFGEYFSPKLTTIEQPMYEMGLEAANMLINHIEHDIPLFTRVFDAGLIERETVKR